MSRKNTILIAILLNVGLLATLFATAINTNPSIEEVARGHSSNIAQKDLAANARQIDVLPFLNESSNASQSILSFHNALSNSSDDPASTVPSYGIPITLSSDSIATDSKSPVTFLNAPTAASNENKTPQTLPMTSATESTDTEITEYVEVKVRVSDTLAKLARVNGVTAEEIKQLNHLTSDQLSAGQILRIPLVSSQSVKNHVVNTTAPARSSSTSNGVEYYIVKSGDNPWTIANKHKIKVDELLKLNNLNKETARQLKPGDKLRIR